MPNDPYAKPERLPNSLRGRPGVRLGVALFLILFIAAGIAFAFGTGGVGAPILFPIIGIAFAVFGGFILYSAMTRGGKGVRRIDPDSPIVDARSHQAAPASDRCPGCGARRSSNGPFCSRCGAKLT